MTYDEYEISPESGRPVELFVFTIAGSTYRYTSAEDDVVVDSDTYEATAISRGNSGDGAAKRDGSFEIELPASNEVAQLYVNIIPGARVRIEVTRYHRDDTPTPDLVEIFSGFVEAVDFIDDGYKAKMRARSALAGLSRMMPRYGYQSQCNHVLFDADCKISETASAYRLLDTIVTSADTRFLTIAAAALFVDGWFTGGFVEEAGSTDFRLVLSHVGDQIEMMLPFVETPLTVTLYAGCAHTVGVCKSKFDNVINYGGFAWVPTRNPFESGI